MSAFDTIHLPEHSACATAIKRVSEGGWADVLADSMGGAVNEVMANDERSGAFPHRKTVYSMQFNVFWPADSTDQVIRDCESWLESVYAAAGSAGISDDAYRNYPSKTLPSTGKAGYRRLYYGNNLERLLEVKAIYDPQSIFSYAQGLSQHPIMPVPPTVQPMPDSSVVHVVTAISLGLLSILILISIYRWYLAHTWRPPHYLLTGMI